MIVRRTGGADEIECFVEVQRDRCEDSIRGRPVRRQVDRLGYDGQRRVVRRTLEFNRSDIVEREPFRLVWRKLDGRRIRKVIGAADRG